MYIIVVGGGRLGYYLVKALLAEGDEVLMIEKDAAICERVNKELGNVCLHGDGCETTTLSEAGTSRADMFITVTGDDEDNLVSCQVAKYKFNVPRTIARVRNPNNERLFKILGVDVTINSTNIILEHLAREVPSHPVTRLMSLQDKEVEIVELHIQAGSPAVGRALKDIELPARAAISLIIRPDQKPVVPRNDTVLEAGDRVLAVTPGEAEPALRAALTGS